MGRIDKKIAKQLKFEAGGDNKEYEVEDICNSMVYTRESEASQLLGLYYLVSWKNYPEDKSIWKPVSAVQYFWKLVIIFHKDHSDKPTATFSPIDLAPPMAKHIAPPNINGKRKRGRPVGSVRKKEKY